MQWCYASRGFQNCLFIENVHSSEVLPCVIHACMHCVCHAHNPYSLLCGILSTFTVIIYAAVQPTRVILTAQGWVIIDSFSLFTLIPLFLTFNFVIWLNLFTLTEKSLLNFMNFFDYKLQLKFLDCWKCKLFLWKVRERNKHFTDSWAGGCC